MTHPAFIRLNLKNDVTIGDLSRLAWDLDWDIYEIIKGDDRTPFEKIWLANDDRAVIHYIEDRLIGVRYMRIEGEGQAEITAGIRANVGIYDRAEITEMYDTAGDEKALVRALRHMGTAAQPSAPDLDWAARFQQAAVHPSPVVRRAVVLAAVYAGWCDLRSLIQSLAEADPDPETRARAQAALDALEKHAGGVVDAGD
jgi:hypothetical protein